MEGEAVPNYASGMVDSENVNRSSQSIDSYYASIIRSMGDVPDPSSTCTDENEPRTFPMLFDEANWSLETSILIYGFTDLRQLAREGRISNPETVLMEPIHFHKVLQLLNTNRDEIIKSWGAENTQLFIDLIDAVEKALEDRVTKAGYNGNYVHVIESISAETFGIVKFCDENKEEEPVYTIAVDSLSKKVTVTFRGTVTYKDMKTDLRMMLDRIPNPLADVEGQPKMIHVHSGFADYLYNTSEKDTTARKGSPKQFRDGTTCSKILDDVVGVLKEHPGFSLYTSGHSLGAALASLFAFEAASSNDPHIPQPVSCIGIASPMVGNKVFRSAFSYLEMKGRVRYLNVQNKMDPIPLMPSRGWLGPLLALVAPKTLYGHVGMQLRLSRGGKGFKIVYIRCRVASDLPDQIYRSFSEAFFCPVFCWHGAENHGCKQYHERMMTNWRELKDLELNDFYEEVLEGRGGVLFRDRPLSMLR